ncbi:MAG: hypothetical protein HRT57_10635 [Crocinitomicaceae bacterium]|nr:hypothetical protein [Crocinitomicaceae bacterium]
MKINNYKRGEQRIYELSDEVQLDTDNGLRYFAVNDWIDRHPNILYQHIYRSYSIGLNKYRLCEQGVKKLKLALHQHHPSLFQEMLQRKALMAIESREQGKIAISKLVKQK